MDWFNQWTGFYMITASVMKELIMLGREKIFHRGVNLQTKFSAGNYLGWI